MGLQKCKLDDSHTQNANENRQSNIELFYFFIFQFGYYLLIIKEQLFLVISKF